MSRPPHLGESGSAPIPTHISGDANFSPEYALRTASGAKLHPTPGLPLQPCSHSPSSLLTSPSTRQNPLSLGDASATTRLLLFSAWNSLCNQRNPFACQELKFAGVYSFPCLELPTREVDVSAGFDVRSVHRTEELVSTLTLAGGEGWGGLDHLPPVHLLGEGLNQLRVGGHLAPQRPVFFSFSALRAKVFDIFDKVLPKRSRTRYFWPILGGKKYRSPRPCQCLGEWASLLDWGGFDLPTCPYIEPCLPSNARQFGGIL